MIKPIGLVIREIAEEKNLKAYALSEKIGRGRTYAYDTFRRKSMSIQEVADWAKLLGVTSDEILDRQTRADAAPRRVLKKERIEVEAKGDPKNSTNSDYLLKYLKELEARISEQANTINQQAQTIQVLLGKSEPVSTAGIEPGNFFLPFPGTVLGTGGQTSL